MSVSTEHVENPSANDGDNQSNSNLAAGNSVTIDQMVRDFIIAKAIALSGNGDRGGSSTNTEQSRKGQQRKSSKDKKKKKKKKKNRSHHKESSRRRRQHRHRGHRSSDASSESDSTDDDCKLHPKCAGDLGEERHANHSVTNDDTYNISASVKKDEECVNSSMTSQAIDVEESFSKLGKCNEYSVESDHVSLTITGKQCISEATDTVFSNLQRSTEMTCHAHSQHTSLSKHSVEARARSKQDESRECKISSKSRQHTDISKTSCYAQQKHPSKENRSSRDCDKLADVRTRSPSSENISSEKRSFIISSSQSDDVVFIKKVSSHEESSFTCFDGEKSHREEKSSRGNRQNITTSDSSQRYVSKRRYDLVNSEDDKVVSKCKSKKNGRHGRESPVILLSDDDVDILTDEMAEKLHRRLTTSIKKSKELQAEKELNIAASVKVSDSSASFSSKLIEEPAHCDVTKILISSYSDVVLPTKPATSHSEVSNTSESTKQSAAQGLLGKKMLKFGLKITESSAAWISKGIKSSQNSGEYIVFFICMFVIMS